MNCSRIIECTISYKIKCVHCKALNYVSVTASNDPTNFDLEAITCWLCGEESLVDEELMEMYPDYPNESVGGQFDGKREP